MCFPKRLVSFTLTCALGIGLASLFTFGIFGWRNTSAADYDLTGRVISYSPNPIKVGDRVTFKHAVSNKGRADVSAKTYDAEFYVDGKLVSFDRATSKIAAGKEIVYTKVEGSSDIEANRPGTHTYRLLIDPQNRLAEANESNNVIEGTFEVVE